MAAILYVVTREEDGALRKALLSEIPDAVRRFDLTLANPDYGELLRAVFEADTIVVW